jgi:hypothetical protein
MFTLLFDGNMNKSMLWWIIIRDSIRLMICFVNIANGMFIKVYTIISSIAFVFLVIVAMAHVGPCLLCGGSGCWVCSFLPSAQHIVAACCFCIHFVTTTSWHHSSNDSRDLYRPLSQSESHNSCCCAVGFPLDGLGLGLGCGFRVRVRVRRVSVRVRVRVKVRVRVRVSFRVRVRVSVVLS